MPLRIEPHAEPIPGYRLIERLGGGGFGEVWKAEAPGGLFKAIKFVYGEIRSKTDNADAAESKSVNYSNGDENSRADQELKSLSRVKEVHHPYILSLERYDIIDNQLIIVMELADRTLWDRFKECRGQGLPGIPRDELLGYMQETAEALDLMNNQFQLQHLDIKPQNLFLVFNHVKVADFGLVKDLGSKAAATITGGVTPVYAAPETFDGWLSRQSDQYSLAIVFQELLTGQRPFNGSTMRQLILQHIQGVPDLSLLPASDRAAVGKALAKNPDDRFGGCLEFVKALHAGPAPKAAPAPAVPHWTATPQQPLPIHQLQQPIDDRDQPIEAITRGSRGRNAGPVKPATDEGFEESLNGDRPNLVSPRPDRRAETPSPAPPSSKSRSGERLTGSTKPSGQQTGVNGQQVASPRPADQGGVVQPSLIIGLGQMGLETLSQFRVRLGHEFGQPEAVPHIRLLGIDTDPQTAAMIAQADGHAGLSNGEIVLARLHRPSHYIKGAGAKAPTDTWLNPKLIYRIPREQGNAGLRALGRLAFVDNYRVLAKRIEIELQACLSADTLHESARSADLGLRSANPRVYIVANLAGGTGSGMFLDVAYVTRMLLRRLGYDGAEIVGLLYLPPVGRDGIRSNSLANTYASLLELNHFSRDEAVFAARYENNDPQTRNDPLCEIGAPLQRCVLLPLPEQRGSLVQEENAKATALAGDFLFRDLASPLGRVIDEQRRLKLSLSNDYLMPGGNLLCQSFGLSRMTWPRRALLKRCSRRLCKRLIDRWMSKDARPVADEVREHTAEQWDKAGMRAENLIERFQTLCETRMKQPPERLFAGMTNGLVNVLTPKNVNPAGPPTSINLAPVLGVLEQFDKLVGLPDECRASHQNAEPSVLETTISDASRKVIDDCEQKLSEIAVRLIEDPRFRLAGAEEALRQFNLIVEQSLKAQETLGKELHERSIQILNKIQQFLETPSQAEAPTMSIWKAPFSRAASTNNFGADLLELVRSYPRTRYHALVLAQVSKLYVALRGYLSDQVREVGFCRQRLGELASYVLPAGSEAEPPNTATPQLRVLLPANCANIDDALELIETSITHDDLLAFDERMQTLIRKQYRALVQVCMGTASVVRNLAPAFVFEAEKFLEPRFRGSSVAEMLFAQKEQEGGDVKQAVLDDLLEFFDESAPDLGRLSESKEIAVALIPGDARGKEIFNALKSAIPQASVLASDRADEIVFYREITRVSLPELDQMGSLAQEAYRQRMALDPSSLHSREDITEWQPVAALKR